MIEARSSEIGIWNPLSGAEDVKPDLANDPWLDEEVTRKRYVGMNTLRTRKSSESVRGLGKE